jgi:UDP-N-acetylglucosamine 2-epimerase (non-hydrolysing)
MHILHVVGARPNFMKAAPVLRALRAYEDVRQTLVHTGQHYDTNMSDIFFQELEIPEPDSNLGVGSGSHAQQTAQILIQFEPVVLGYNPDVVLVYGDINSTMAAALVCAKLCIPVGHVEAGLRSFDRTMPEEINRLITDQIADFLFTPSIDGDENLLREGVAADKIHRVGNVMIDSLVRLNSIAQESTVVADLNLQPGNYGLVTLHRPSNVDDPTMLASLLDALDEISRELVLIFSVHPRTRQRLEASNTNHRGSRVRMLDPLSYIDFLALQRSAKLVITDSGGIQEETTYLGVPCLTVRKNTERPVTVTSGTNILIGDNMARLKQEVARILAGRPKQGNVPPLWDGHAAVRIAAVITSKWSKSDLSSLRTAWSEER